MSKPKQILVKGLSLDLHNFRTIGQPNELEAVKAMITINPDRFWALMDSLLDDGYLPTENIIAIKETATKKVVVKEGNRRIAALKIIYGLLPATQLGIPNSTQNKISILTSQWKNSNKTVPCTLYEASDKTLVEKIVNLAHGKGEKASRDPWPTVAKARYNRDVSGAVESGLDLLEKYIRQGRNLTGMQKERFSGNYPLTVLDEAMSKLVSRLGVTNSVDLATKYPNIQQRDALENLMLAIGQKEIGFEGVRSQQNDFAVRYGFPALRPTPTPTPAPTTSPTSSPTPSPTPPPSPSPTPTPAPGCPTPAVPPTPTPPALVPAAPINTPKSVTNKLNLFRPTGANREKVVTLKDEILNLNIPKTTIAFCFLLRSMFEISAKAYCIDHALSYTNGTRDKNLIDLLRAVTNHITNGQPNHPMTRPLHGALSQLANPQSLLSVTSMNQLVHNTAFSVTASDVCTLFHNIYPLLEAMN